MSLLVVRLKGEAGLRHDQSRTFKSLRLHAPNHATIVPENPSYRGMLKKLEHHTTYGDLDVDTAVNLIETRGRGPGDVPVDDAYVAEHTDFGSVEELAQALVDEELDIAKLDPAIKPVFRLNPARGGLEGTKHHFVEGGALGYRGEEISDLIERML